MPRYKNGNYIVTILEDGTKIRKTGEDEFIPKFSENIDCKITDKCSQMCKFCYEGCTPDAPWNQIDPEPQEVEVTISMTISKTVKVKVTDYTCEEDWDEEGYHGINYDFSDCNLEQAVKDQIILPTDTKEFCDWNEDDFVVNLEE